MVSLLPRVNSLAMSGTPAKADIKDLMGSLRFLRVPVIPRNQHLWHRLQQTPLRPAFEGLFRQLAVRTTKREVAAEFDIPAQTRFIVPIELSEIEMHYYDDTLERQRQVLGLPADIREQRASDWVLDRALFRTCLYTLRQICTHIQVGQMQQQGSRAQRLHLGRELMTMGEALKRMKEDHAQDFLVESRNQVSSLDML
jgi:E3 ubiquitin-protein ligase SHPRH